MSVFLCGTSVHDCPLYAACCIQQGACQPRLSKLIVPGTLAHDQGMFIGFDFWARCFFYFDFVEFLSTIGQNFGQSIFEVTVLLLSFVLSIFGVFGWPPDYGRHGPDCYPGAICFMQPDLCQSKISKQIARYLFSIQSCSKPFLGSCL